MRTIITTCVALIALAGVAHAQNTNDFKSNTEVFTGLNFESTNKQPDSIDTTPGVYPPGMDAGTNPCAVGGSAGGSVTGFGLAFGGTWTAEDCNDRNWYALLTSRQQTETAKAYACLNNENIRKALIASGTDCYKYERRLARAESNNAERQMQEARESGNNVPAYCRDRTGAWASKDQIKDNCPNSEAILNARMW